MSLKPFVLSAWVDKLSGSLQEVVSYERRLESELLFLRQRDQMALGLSGNAPYDPSDIVRERVALYSLPALRESPLDSVYRQNIA